MRAPRSRSAYFVRYRPGPERERLLLRVALGVAIACVAVGGAVVAASGNPFGAQTEVAQGPSRLAEGSLNNRWEWWKEAWHGWVGEPLGGTGAGSFELVHRKFRDSSVDVREPHDLPLQFASETGLVGLLLWGGAIAAALLGAWRALGRLRGDEREAALALGIALPAFLVHGLLDYDWDFVALCAAVFFVTGFLLATGREPVRVGREYAWVAAVVLVDVGRALLDRGAADRRPPGRRGLLADRERLVRGGRDGEERALAEPALDRAARGVGRGGGDVRTARSRARGSMCARSTSSL